MSNKEKTAGIITLGCKVNQYESEAIAEALCAKGYTVLSPDEPCSAYIINTCTVTAESDRKARQLIRRVMTHDPDAYVLVTGCYSQTNPSAVASVAGVDYICGSSNKLSVVDALEKLTAVGRKSSSPEINIPDLLVAEFEKMSITKFDRTRAYVKIQDGCESRCTYCAIPGARGKVRSKPYEEVIEEVRRLTENGCREVVLTGIETGAYGRDLPGEDNLASLLCQIDKIPGIGRVRLGSLDPAIIKPSFVEKIRDLSSLTHHFHLSIQSGSDRILALMKRKYNSAQAMRAIESLREVFPDLQLTTDIIVGFPTETEEEFNATAELAKRAGFLMMHVFPYSKRSGTPAAEMQGQIDDAVKKARTAKLTALSRELRSNILDKLTEEKTVTKVLFESASGGYMYGHNAEFVEVRVKSKADLHAEIKNVRLLSHDGDVCEGEITDNEEEINV